MPRRSNPRRVKLHRSYSVDEAAKCLGVHKNTVRRWLKEGLPQIGGRGQTLILGRDSPGLPRREAADGQSSHCPLGFMFCLKCRAPNTPACQMIEYVPLTGASGNLKALCPDCPTLMFRRIRQTDLPTFKAAMLRHAQEASARLIEQ